MRATFLTTLVLLLAACGSSAVRGQELGSLAPASDRQASSNSASGEAEVPKPSEETGGDRPGILSASSASTSSPAESSAPARLEMTIPLVAWNSVQRVYELQLVDPATCQVYPGRTPIEVGHSADYPPTLRLSPDGSQLAVAIRAGSACVAYEGCWGAADEVQVIDLLTWHQVTAGIAAQFPEAHTPLKGWIDPLAFSPDGARLALAYHNREGTTAMLFDTQTGQLLGREPLTIRPRLMEFIADGAQLVICGAPLAEIPWISQPDSPSVLLLDASSLQIQWSQFLPDILEGSWCLENCEGHSEVTHGAYWRPAVEFSPGLQELYIVHADADRLTTVDFQDRSVRSQVIGPSPSWIERLLAMATFVAEAKGSSEGSFKSAVLSPDGTRLYMIGWASERTQNPAGDWQASETVLLGLHVIDVSTGHELPTLESKADWIRTTPDDRYMLLSTGWPGSTEVFASDSLEPLGHVEGWEVQPSRRLNGEPILMAIQYGPTLYRPARVALLDPETFELLPSWSATGIGFLLTAP